MKHRRPVKPARYGPEFLSPHIFPGRIYIFSTALFFSLLSPSPRFSNSLGACPRILFISSILPSTLLPPEHLDRPGSSVSSISNSLFSAVPFSPPRPVAARSLYLLLSSSSSIREASGGSLRFAVASPFFVDHVVLPLSSSRFSSTASFSPDSINLVSSFFLLPPRGPLLSWSLSLALSFSSTVALSPVRAAFLRYGTIRQSRAAGGTEKRRP